MTDDPFFIWLKLVLRFWIGNVLNDWEPEVVTLHTADCPALWLCTGL